MLQRPSDVETLMRSQWGGDAQGLLVTRVCAKDSRELIDGDIAAVVDAIRVSSARHILVIVGTYMLPNLARELEQRLNPNSAMIKVVGVLGAMVPLQEARSDGGFQLGFASGIISSLRPGVHVLFHGRVMEPSRVYKDNDRNRILSRL